MRRYSITVGVILVAIASSLALQAKVARMSYFALVATSDLILVGSDSSVETVGQWKVAHFTVEKVVKGRPPAEVQYLASPTWDCDIASAKLGERVLLFLRLPIPRTAPGAPPADLRNNLVYEISFAGRGRMPVDTTEDGQDVQIPTGDIELPEDVPTSSGSDPRSTLGRRVPLSILRDLVYQAPNPPQPR